MPHPKPNKRKLTDLFLKKLQPQASTFVVWDLQQRGLAIRVQPTGHKSWKCIYAFHGRPRWYHIGAADAIGLADARQLAGEVMLEVARGKDPAADRKAERGKGTFGELVERYVEEYAKKKNKSWMQPDKLVRRFLVPRWGKLQAADISRSDVKAMAASIEAPSVANQTTLAASAIFSWAIREDIVKLNPCQKIEQNDMQARERVLSDSEIPQFWSAFDSAGLVGSAALKMILLTGQRPGEVRHMRREHIVDGWWQMPGQPVPELGWPGTKNGQSHMVFLPAPALALLEQMDGKGFVFPGARGRAMNNGQLPKVMRAICKKLAVEPATPHDLRRTFSSKVAELFTTQDMNRLTNHREGGITSVYDRSNYAEKNKKIMEAVAAKIMDLVEGKPADNVVRFKA